MQEDFMQIRNAPAAADGGDLLACRMAMFGLDRDTLVNTDKYAFAEILRRCVNCTFREACTIDLKRDPNNPVWETYCPNAGTLIGLTAASWLTD
jgi:hypothetical protein